MIQVIDIVQGRDDDTGDASVHLDRVYDHMYPDLTTFIRGWEEVLVDMENTSWGGQTIVSYDEDAEEWHNLIIRRLEIEGDTIRLYPLTKEEIEAELFK